MNAIRYFTPQKLLKSCSFSINLSRPFNVIGIQLIQHFQVWLHSLPRVCSWQKNTMKIRFVHYWHRGVSRVLNVMAYRFLFSWFLFSLKNKIITPDPIVGMGSGANFLLNQLKRRMTIFISQAEQRVLNLPHFSKIGRLHSFSGKMSITFMSNSKD